MTLTTEQNDFIKHALHGENVLVDACVGSGKTTAIQHLCDALPTTRRILYLTYNKLLKVDAKEKIVNFNVMVTNYHGFAYTCLRRAGESSGVSDLIQTFNRVKPYVGHCDVLVIDEYQDIDLEISKMLMIIKEQNPDIQIIAVGDIKQKIYDKTTLEIVPFMEQFIGPHVDLEFTQCFRLSKPIADMLSRVWGKKIVGVNPNCKVRSMKQWDVVKFLSQQEPSDILCLGSRNGAMSEVLNALEDKYRAKFNKETVYASITNNDKSGSTQPSKDTAIFTTYDGSKGLERKICVIFDWTEDYWTTRVRMPETKYEILRNIFCVASSRGKEEIIYVKKDEMNGKTPALLSEKTLSTPVGTNHKMDNVGMSTMFDFKYKEDVEDAFHLLDIRKVSRADKFGMIDVVNHDGMIDLAPCIGIYQEAMYFKGYDIDKELEMYKQIARDRSVDIEKYKKLDKKVLYLISLQTNQKRYIKQVENDLMQREEKIQLASRLSTEFTRDELVQRECEIQFADQKGVVQFTAAGYCDVIKDDIVYELKFVSELQHEHFLQCACYMIALGLERGRLWNTKNNDMYEIRIPSRTKFMDAVTKAVTKHQMLQYIKPKIREEWKQNYKKEVV